ncbi:hypothetical protein TWF694_001984 [Orbilia ellipsospora]|uniref:Uncharacterized protein n=1 Tax=Orbilia ellipsospora TaxID=2528407 RepID=A0AAV9X738_9PEZI
MAPRHKPKCSPPRGSQSPQTPPSRQNRDYYRNQCSTSPKAVTAAQSPPPAGPAMAPNIKQVRILCAEDEYGYKGNSWSIYLMWHGSKNCTHIQFDPLKRGNFAPSDLRIITFRDVLYRKPTAASKEMIFNINVYSTPNEAQSDSEDGSEPNHGYDSDDDSDDDEAYGGGGGNANNKRGKDEIDPIPARFFIREIYQHQRDYYRSVEGDTRWWIYRIIRDFSNVKLVEMYDDDRKYFKTYLQSVFTLDDRVTRSQVFKWKKGTFPDLKPGRCTNCHNILESELRDI